MALIELHPQEGTQKGRGGQWIPALCLAGLVASTHAGTHQIEGRIVGVHDGDTITLLDADNRQHKIRLDGIDAPELGQPFGRTPTWKRRRWPSSAGYGPMPNRWRRGTGGLPM